MKPKIYEIDLPQKIKGIYDNSNNESIVLINKNMTHSEKICTTIEELIHCKYFPDANYCNCNNYYDVEKCRWIECKVKKMVAKTLIPDIVLETHVLPYLESYSLNEIAEEINVTEEILKLRLEEYKK